MLYFVNKPHPFLDKRNPDYLLNLFTLMAVLSVAVILLAVGFGIYMIYGGKMLRDAEEVAISVGRAIFEQEKRVLLQQGPDGRTRISVAKEDFQGLDERMRKYLQPFHIYKIKVFSQDKVIVYSTDPSIVGKVDSGNAKLETVLLSGEIISRLEKKGEVWDLAGEQLYDVDVVETYLPIKAGDEVVGSFEVYVDITRTRQQIAKVLTLSLTVLFSVLVAVFACLYIPVRRGTLRLKKTQEELHSRATTDALTGMFNRRYLLSRIHEEYSRMLRQRRRPTTKTSVGFIMVDIDHFNQINDAYGHLVGDGILKEVSARLKGNIRGYDVIGRYGGEEFLVMLPNADLQEAKHVAERMHKAVREAPFAARDAAVNVALSMGVACSRVDEEDMFAAIDRADEALCKAKNAGCDRVVCVK